MWPNADGTQELILAAREGDAGAVNRLLSRHRDAIHRLIELRMDRAIAGRVDASDIVQDTLVEASRRLKQYLANPEMPFHLWIRQIARDRLIDAHRRHRAAERRSVDREQPLAERGSPSQSSLFLFQQLEAQGVTPASQAIRKELELRFAAALEEMEEIDREILLMRHFEQLTNQEAATALGLTEPAASMRYLRALRRLRALLGQEEP